MKNEQKPITFWDKPIYEYTREELETEIKLQKLHRALLITELNKRKKKEEKAVRIHQIRFDKMDFLDAHIKVLDGFIDELERKLSTRSDGTEEGRTKVRRAACRMWVDRQYVANHIDSDGAQPSWDRDKFMLVARDRGYLTEQSITYAVEKELAVTRALAERLLDKGKFTWGQVMCIGAMLRMTPKEFCDIFLSGYFVEYYGQFEASYQNIDKTLLLKRATVMNSKDLEKVDTAIAEMEAAAD